MQPPEKKDMFKLQLPSSRWVDAYGRDTSPSKPVKAKMPKPNPSMRGYLMTSFKYDRVAEVTVTGHLATGWGDIIGPDGTSGRCFKSTPGQVVVTPLMVMDMPYWIQLFLTTCDDAPAGRLYTATDIMRNCTFEYKAQGESSAIRVRLMK